MLDYSGHLHDDKACISSESRGHLGPGILFEFLSNQQPLSKLILRCLTKISSNTKFVQRYMTVEKWF